MNTEAVAAQAAEVQAKVTAAPKIQVLMKRVEKNPTMANCNVLHLVAFQEAKRQLRSGPLCFREGRSTPRPFEPSLAPIPPVSPTPP